MGKNAIYSVGLLTLIWVVLMENASIPFIALGVIISALCLYLCRKFLPFGEVNDVSFARFALYPFILVWQIYLAGIHIIKVIFTGAEVKVVDVTPKLRSEFLLIALGHSITLTPGTIFLGMNEDKVSVLWLKGIKEQTPDDIDDALKGALERPLLRAEKRG